RMLLNLPASVIVPVADRLGHDRRYALDDTRMRQELGWIPQMGWQEGLALTVKWYQDHSVWWKDIKSGAYQEYYKQNYGAFAQ
ncbi:MAG: dTDP-glucose 4,6-dehydratase, partial [Firmicutes bacterium]|nr:dTDP-glucose 4,6-dehydratase [Bacillota bacterium]